MSFTAFDVETANSSRGSICAIGYAVVREGALIEQGQWLCRPPDEVGHFDAFNVRLHGITPEWSLISQHSSNGCPRC